MRSAGGASRWRLEPGKARGAHHAARSRTEAPMQEDRTPTTNRARDEVDAESLSPCEELEVKWDRDPDQELLDRVRDMPKSIPPLAAEAFAADEPISQDPSAALDGSGPDRSIVNEWLREKTPARSLVVHSASMAAPAPRAPQQQEPPTLVHILSGLKDSSSDDSPPHSTHNSPKERGAGAAASPAERRSSKRRRVSGEGADAVRTPLQNITNVLAAGSASSALADISPGFELALLTFDMPAAVLPPSAASSSSAPPAPAALPAPPLAAAAAAERDEFQFDLDLADIDIEQLDAATAAASRPLVAAPQPGAGGGTGAGRRAGAGERRAVLRLVAEEVGEVEPVLPGSTHYGQRVLVCMDADEWEAQQAERRKREGRERGRARQRDGGAKAEDEASDEEEDGGAQAGRAASSGATGSDGRGGRGEDGGGPAGRRWRVLLRGGWQEGPVATGDRVNVVLEPGEEAEGDIVVDQAKNALVVQPDVLVSGTRVSESWRCMRSALIDELFPGATKTGESRNAILRGTLLHAVFERALVTRQFGAGAIAADVERTLADHVEDLYAIGAGEEEMRRELLRIAEKVGEWAATFVREEPVAAGRVQFGTRAHRVAIERVADVEEAVWSPAYGLKGSLDATVRLRLAPDDDGAGRAGESVSAPLELKTGALGPHGGGQRALQYKAQVILYTLLLSDRYGRAVDKGLVYYMANSGMQGVQVERGETWPLLDRRNALATHIHRAERALPGWLPPLLCDARTCSYCCNLPTCALLHRAVEGGTQESADAGGIGAAFAAQAHVTEAHGDYLRRWNAMIDLEFGSVTATKSEVWRWPSARRERLGRCLADVAPAAFRRDGASFLYRFLRRPRPAAPPGEEPPSVAELQMAEGDGVVVSVEGGPFAVASGRIEAVEAAGVVVRLHKALSARVLRCTPAGGAGAGQDAADLVDIETLGTPVFAPRPASGPAAPGWQPLAGPDGAALAAARWRVDKDESRAGYGLLKENVASLFLPPESRLRELVVDLAPPAFEPLAHADGLLADPRVAGCGVVEALNGDQMRALRAVLAAKDYVLLLGMPGTGKTTTIAALVRVLLALGRSVLVTAHTHTAVDNILLKLKEAGVDFLRVGNPAQVHADLQPHTVHGAGPVDTVPRLHERLMSPRLVGSTCLGVSHPMFSKREPFDVVVVDEASQISEAACVGPLRFGRTFLLVGDHFQLPPVVKQAEARALGMARPLFERLCEKHGAALVQLETQYRMAADVMLLSNALVYDSRLRCGNEAVATGTLEVPRLRELAFAAALPAWLADALQPGARVRFLDTDGCPAMEARGLESVTNDGEARLVAAVAAALLAGGVPARDIGVISPYRAQVRLLGGRMRAVGGAAAGPVDVHTIDKYQGRDKGVVLISFVRSNPAANVGDLLRDWRRLNVAFTRARSKLIMVGSRSTLAAEPFLARLFALIDCPERRWIYPLPSNAHLFIPSFPPLVEPSERAPASDEGSHSTGPIPLRPPPTAPPLPPPSAVAKPEAAAPAPATAALIPPAAPRRTIVGVAAVGPTVAAALTAVRAEREPPSQPPRVGRDAGAPPARTASSSSARPQGGAQPPSAVAGASKSKAAGKAKGAVRPDPSQRSISAFFAPSQPSQGAAPRPSPAPPPPPARATNPFAKKK